MRSLKGLVLFSLVGESLPFFMLDYLPGDRIVGDLSGLGDLAGLVIGDF